DTGPRAGHLLAGDAQRLAGKERENLRRAHGLADTFDQRLAFLARQKLSELVLAGRDLVRDHHQRVIARLWIGARKAVARSLGSGDRGLRVGAGRARIFADDLLEVGRADDRSDGLRLDPLARDEILLD